MKFALPRERCGPYWPVVAVAAMLAVGCSTYESNYEEEEGDSLDTVSDTGTGTGEDTETVPDTSDSETEEETDTEDGSDTLETSDTDDDGSDTNDTVTEDSSTEDTITDTTDDTTSPPAGLTCVQCHTSEDQLLASLEEDPIPEDTDTGGESEGEG